MFKFYSFAIIFITSTFINAQRPVAVVGDHPDWPLQSLGQVNGAVEFNNKLYLTGNLNTNSSLDMQGIAIWDGHQYSSISVPLMTNNKYSICEYNNQIAVGYRSTGNVHSVSTFDGSEWNLLGSGANADLGNKISELCEHNGQLFAGGSIDECVAKWDGTSWSGTNGNQFNFSSDLISFNGDLYATVDDSLVVKYIGTGWEVLSVNAITSHLYGSFIYENDLYFTGEFELDNENFGLARLEDNNLVVFTEGNVHHAVRTGCFYSNHFYSIDNFHLYEDDRMLYDTEIFTLPPSGHADFLEYNNELYMFYSTKINQPFPEVYFSHMYRLEQGAGSAMLNSENHKIKAYFDANSDFFATELPGLNLDAGFYFPTDSVTSAIYSSEFVISGIIDGDSLANGPQHTLGNEVFAWFCGPITEEVDNSFLKNYQRVWKVTASEIAYHISHTSSSDYIIPNDIATWPGNGRFDHGEAHMLAPFHDVNGDTWYQPEDGDYPLILGDQAVFMLLNNKFNLHTESFYLDPTNTSSLVIEAHVMFYSFDNAPPPLDQTIFMHASIFNRSDIDFTEFKIGLFNDFDIGNPTNDFVGSSEELDYTFAYNSSNVDEDNNEIIPAVPGFGLNPPASASIMLSHEMSMAAVFGTTSGFGIPSSERTYSRFASGQGFEGGPITLNGQEVGPFVYSDSPCLPDGENEFFFSNTPQDRITMSMSTAETLAAGQYLCFDVAYTVSSGVGDYLQNVCALDDVVSQVRTFYDQNILQPCALVNGLEENSGYQQFALFPVPTSQYLILQTVDPLPANTIISIHDTMGQTVKQMITLKGATQQQLDVSYLSAGIYLLKAGEQVVTFLISH